MGDEYRYRPAWWLPGAHAQTLWGRVARGRSARDTVDECLALPDGDSLELRHLPGTPSARRLLLLHGLEGSPRSHYVSGVLSAAAALGWGATLLVFRGCGSAPNVARRFYHSGETEDLEYVVATLRARWPESHWFLMGVSLGGNVLLKWLGERGSAIDRSIRAAAAVSVPFDLEAGAKHIAHGFARVYDRNFLRSLRRKAMKKLATYPDLFDRARLEQAKSIYEFDDAVTAPVHGFVNARDYYERSSSLQFLSAIRVPTLLLSSFDDPFLPPDVLARVEKTAGDNRYLTAEFHSHGGHVGFVGGRFPWKPVYYAERRVFEFFHDEMEHTSKERYDSSPSKRGGNGSATA